MCEPIPSYEPYQPAAAAPAGTLRCPKCGGAMRTYERNGVHLEQCQGCRGVFLDFGELEHLTQLESRLLQPPPQAAPMGYGPGPDWGYRGNQRYHRRGLGSLFFSS